jgi:hypothetical protein
MIILRAIAAISVTRVPLIHFCAVGGDATVQPAT